MVTRDVLDKLVQLYKSDKYAPYFFEEIAAMRQTKPSIDLERRRRSINITKKMNINRQQAEEFFAVLQELRLGKLELFKDITEGNSKFHWTCKDVSPIELALEVIKMASKGGSPEKGTSTGEKVYYIFKTEAGQFVKLSKEDIIGIKNLF